MITNLYLSTPKFRISYILQRYFPNQFEKPPHTGYNNCICHILMVIFNRIERLRIPKYILYSITLFYLQGFAVYEDNGEHPYLRPNIIESYLKKVRVYATSTYT